MRLLILKWVLFFSLALCFSARAEAQKIRLAEAASNAQEMVFLAAKENGYYRDEGLNVELIVMRPATANLALIGNNVEFHTLGATGLISSLRGAPLRVVFSSFVRPVFYLYAKPNIRSIRDLKGKRVGVASIGTSFDFHVREILKANGLDTTGSVIVQGLGDNGTRYGALVAGATDAVMLTPPWNFKAEEAGFQLLASSLKYDLLEIQGSIVVRENFLRSDPVIVEKFVRGTTKGLRYVQQNRAGAVSTIARAQRISEGLAEKVYDLVRPAMSSNGALTGEQQTKLLENTARLQGLKDFPGVEMFFDYSIVRKTQTDLDVSGWIPGHH